MPEAEWIVVHSREQEGVLMQIVVPIDLYGMVRDGQMPSAIVQTSVLMTRTSEPSPQRADDHSTVQSRALQSRAK